MAGDDERGNAPREVRITVPVRLFLESQDHQHDLIKELKLIEIGDRFDLASESPPHQLARLIADILERYSDVRSTTRRQAMVALEGGEEEVTLAVPALPHMAEALREWLALIEEADRFCEEGGLLMLAAPPELRALRRRYVEELARQL